MLRLAFDFIITWRETRTRPNAYFILICIEVFVWFLLVYETLNNRLRLLIISRSYK